MSKSILKPCPCCMGKARVEKRYLGYKNCKYDYYIECEDCGLRTDGDERDKVIRKWNTRKPMERIVEQLEEQQNKNRYENHHDGWNVGIDQAIEIVQKGGVE